MDIKTKKVWLSVCFSLLGLSVVGLFLYGLLSGNDPKAIPTSFIGKPAPNFELKDLNGKSIRLSDYAGKAVILNFWASWCVPCREEAPLLESFWQNYQTKNTVVLGIASNDKPESVQKFIHEFRLTFPTVLDTEKGDVMLDYGVTGIPETFFISPDGIIRNKIFGAVSAQEIETFVATYSR